MLKVLETYLQQCSSGAHGGKLEKLKSELKIQNKNGILTFILNFNNCLNKEIHIFYFLGLKA